MTHEYPPNTSLRQRQHQPRVGLCATVGFTQRQREFLVTVMVHSGCFLERQYCAFTGTVRGQNSREFVARLVARGFARAIEPGPVRRGRLYHVHHKPLYEAIGQADNRNRRLQYDRPHGRAGDDSRCRAGRSTLLVVESRMRQANASSTSRSRRVCGQRSIRTSRSGRGHGRPIRCFPDKLPIGIEKDDTSRFVFLYLVNRRIPVDFRQFLIRHRDLFRNLHTWTVRLLVPRRFRKAVALYKAAVREELWTPLNPSVSKCSGDVLSRTAGAGRTPRRSVRSLHRAGVPEAGHAEDPGPLSGLATTGRQGALAVVLDQPARRPDRTAVRPSKSSC